MTKILPNADLDLDLDEDILPTTLPGTGTRNVTSTYS